MSATFQKALEERAAFKNLVVKLFPGETIFKVCKTPSVLTDAVKAAVVDFYCSDIISVISQSLKDTGLRTSILHGTNRTARLERKMEI